MTPLWTRQSQSLTFKTDEDPSVTLRNAMVVLVQHIAIGLEKGYLQPFRVLRMEVQVDKWNVRLMATAEV